MAPRLRSAVVRIHGLPELVLRVIMLALPLDARARAACVCRGWRALLSDVSLWQVLDLTRAGGVARHRLTENLVRGAVRRAAGKLRIFSFSGLGEQHMNAFFGALIVSDGAELQEVNTDAVLEVQDLAALLDAAPRLQVLNAQVAGKCEGLLPVLRNEPRYGPLRVSGLHARNSRNEVADDVLALAAAVAAHESLTSLHLEGVEFARGLNALVDAAAERRVSSLTIMFCDLDAESVTALARLLQRGSLTKLEVAICYRFPNADEASVLGLCAALRACRKLTHLMLTLNPPTGVSCRVLTELLEAAASLPALSVLDLWRSVAQNRESAGRALGALLRANLPSLRTLSVHECFLTDEGMAPLLDGLAANTHLRELDCRCFNYTSREFERNRVLPALAVLAERAARDAKPRSGDAAARSEQTRREKKSCKPSPFPSQPVSRRMNLRSDYALVGGPRYGGVLQPAQQAQQAPDCDARVTALCKASSNALDSEAGSTFALQREAEALRSDCEALSARAAAMRAEMATLVAEVDVLSAADKRADAELQDAKAEYDKKVQEHQLLLARECRLEEEERRLEESFVQKLEELEDKFNAAHAELEIALHKYNSAAGKEARKTERVAVDKKSLELERVQDLINQAKRRKLCMLIADAEAKTKAAA